LTLPLQEYKLLADKTLKSTASLDPDSTFVEQSELHLKHKTSNKNLQKICNLPKQQELSTGSLILKLLQSDTLKIRHK